MLAVSAFLLAVGAFAAFSEPFFHRREGASEIGHLRSDVGDVLFGGHACRSLRREPRVSTRPSASSRLAKNGSPRDTASAMPATRRSGWRRRAATEPAPGRGLYPSRAMGQRKSTCSPAWRNTQSGWTQPTRGRGFAPRCPCTARTRRGEAAHESPRVGGGDSTRAGSRGQRRPLRSIPLRGRPLLWFRGQRAGLELESDPASIPL